MKSEVDLQDAIQRELAWRKRELYGLKVSARRTAEGKGFVFRGGLVLLCAHWEGFLKKTIDSYVKHVFSQDVILKDLKPCFLGIAYYLDIAKAAESYYPGSKDHHEKLASKIKETIDSPPTKAQWKADTEGNPSSEVLKRLMRSVGLNERLYMDEVTWSATRVFIDEHIIRDRNHIAHGEGIPVEKSELISRLDRMVDLFDLIFLLIMNAAADRCYLYSRQAP